MVWFDFWLFQTKDVTTAVTSLIAKYKGRWPGLSRLKVHTPSSKSNNDYLSEIQEILLKMDGKFFVQSMSADESNQIDQFKIHYRIIG